MEATKVQVHSGQKPLGPPPLSLGNVLASARSLYGNPWLSALRIPRRSSGFFVFLTPDEFGLTYSFHAFSAGGSGKGGYIGEPTLLIGELAQRGVTAEYWSIFTQDYRPTVIGVFNGELSTLSGSIL